jgi:two-component system, NarL family, nitrate/nitrite response regulator NarL
MKPITVLLADDHMVVREGLRALLQAESDIEVIGEAQDGRKAVQLTKALRPAVVVMDIAMPQLNGLEATRQILKMLPATRVLILSAHGDDAYVEQANEIGVAGFLIKQASALVLAKAVREVHGGKRYFSPSVSKRNDERNAMAIRGASGRSKKTTIGLTSREMEVLQLIAEGMANKQTAAELGISIKTVEKHRQSLMRKLDIHDTAGLTRYAITAGIVENAVRLTIEQP